MFVCAVLLAQACGGSESGNGGGTDDMGTVDAIAVKDRGWVFQAGGAENDRGWAVSVSDSTVAASGYFAGQAEFESLSLSALGGTDGFGMLLDTDGRLAWVRRMGGETLATPYSDVTHGVAILGGGDILFSGGFLGDASFESTDGVEEMLQSAGRWDAFVARYDAAGTVLWTSAVAGADSDEFAPGVAERLDGSLAVVGSYFSESATFGQGEGNETTLSTAGGGEAFVATYDAMGSLLWARGTAHPSGSYCGGRGIASVGAALVVGGACDGNTVFGATEPGETTVMSAGGIDAFIASFESTGRFRWVGRVAASGDDWGYAVVASGDDSLFFAGSFDGVAWVEGGSSQPMSLSSEGGDDIFLTRYDRDGDLVWAVRAGGPGDDAAYAVAALPDGGFWVAGGFSEAATFGAGSAAVTLESAGAEDVFVARYDASGTLLSAQRAGGAFTDQALGVAATDSGDAVVTGAFSDQATFFPGTEFETTLTSRGGLDIFVARMPQ